MEKQQNKQMKKYISWGLVVVMVALLALMPLLASRDETEGIEASILSGKAERRDIAATLVGGGTLASEEAVEITIPAAVKLTGYMVGNGDAVAEGEAIASVDRVTVMTAITQVQDTLDYLAEAIEEIREEAISDEVVAQAGGTVKILYAQPGETVQEVMLRNGALAVLSLDGQMAVNIQRNTDLSAGDRVLVTLSDGTEVTGWVESNLDGVLSVTVTDEDYAIGETVKVTTEAGDRIGSGSLYIHSPWNAVAYSGTISHIRVREGDTIAAGRVLMQLEDTGHTADYYRLASVRQEYEEMMLTLFQMYQSETITAPCAGIVSGVDEAGAYMLSGDNTGWKIMFLANAPNGDDETAYVNYVGQVTAVGIDGLVLKMNPQPLNITDYKDLSAVPADPALMTEDAIYSAQVPIYELVEGEWVQVDGTAILPGDVLLFAGDETGSFVWMVRVTSSGPIPDIPNPSEPAEPEEPTDPTEPELPTEPEQPEEPTEPTTEPSAPESSGQTNSELPQTGDFGMDAMPQEEEYQLYGLETVTVASVTSQEKMTLEITIDELDTSKVFLGQSADVTVDALSGERFHALVTRIATSGENDGGNSKFTVELTMEKSGDLLPGMSACAMITLEKEASVLSVPLAALTETGTETVLYTSYDEETGTLSNPVAVTVGASDGEYAQILSGIGEGDAFWYAYYDKLEIADAPERGGFPFGG